MPFLFSVLMMSGLDPSVVVVPPVVQESMQEYATSVSKAHGLNTKRFLAVINCESTWDANVVGDNGNSFGIVQIYLPAHSNIKKEQALDPKWSIDWMAEEWMDGHYRQWSCYNNLYAQSTSVQKM